jgi:osmoprotectant transport system substrate-binding protein
VDRRQIVAGLTAPVLSACGARTGVRVASKNFTEQLILGEIVAQHLEKRLGRAIDRKLNLGGTLLVHQAIVSGSVDVYPEYTGTALTAILKLPPAGSEEAIFARVRQEYSRRFGLEWLPPLGFDDSFAMVILGSRARGGGIRNLSDAAKQPRPWKLGVGYEFLDRPDGLAALRSRYGLKIDGQPRTMDLGLLYRALLQGEVTMAAGNTTDGLLSVLDVKALSDDQHAFPPYQAALVARRQFLQSGPRARNALTELSGKFQETAMRALNYAVDGKHEPVAAVARSFLGAAGLA